MIALLLGKLGHEVGRVGPDGEMAVDYPDVALPVAEAVACGECDLGILIGGQGIGMCIAANKVPGVRAAMAHDPFMARIAREQHHCNVICLAAELTRERDLDAIVRDFILASPVGGRRAREVEKVGRIESAYREAELGDGVRGARESPGRSAIPFMPVESPAEMTRRFPPE